MMMGRFGSVVSANVIGFIIEKNCELTYYIFSFLTFVCLAVSFVIPSEMKTEKSDSK
jgi:MFS transporter, VNT family, synaptic vesicle glycoprotein 2